jgi:glycosyltransferase involved in cell wall biosynthesis
LKIAYFSPLPPVKSGISAYSKHLLCALSSKVDLEVFHYGKCELKDFTFHDYSADPTTLSNLYDFDVSIYHIGNNPHYHTVIRNVLKENPGVVVLHDAVLYYLVAGRGIGGLLRELQLSEKDPFLSITDSLTIVKDIHKNDLLRYGSPEIYPLLGTVLRYAKMVIVHSLTALKAVKKSGFKNKVVLVPHLAYPSVVQTKDKINVKTIRAQMGIAEDDFLVGLFGFIGPTKQIQKVLSAVKELLAQKYRVKLLIVGIGDDLTSLINKFGLSEYIILKGFVNEDDFQKLFSVVDSVINLRFPSSGEASGSLLHAFSHGKATIVSDIAWFSELPDEIVKKVPIGINEVTDLVSALSTWIENPSILNEMGNSAYRYSNIHYSPEIISKKYIDALKML